jgi:hypothetical protein
MTDELEITYRREDAQITEVLDTARESSDPALTRAVATGALSRGITSVNELLTELDEASPERRRQLVNAARQSLGRPTIEEEEARTYLETHRGSADPGEWIDFRDNRLVPK